ncbi:MAG: amidohydrolase, partial [Bacteroidota bacterium]
MTRLSPFDTRALCAVLVLLAASVLPASAQQTTRGTFALTNARIETVANGTIERGTVLIRDGLIAEVGANVRLPDTLDAVIDCTDHTIYPGMI